MDKVVSSIVKSDFISVVLVTGKGFETFQFTPKHPTFKSLHRALVRKNLQRVPKLVTMARALENHTCGQVTFTAGGIEYKGRSVPKAITAMAFKTMRETGNLGAWLKFIDNMYQNPEIRAIDELVEFLERAQAGGYPVPFTDDGCFLAYKSVRSDYLDRYTGTISNAVGQVLMMPRVEVNPNRNETCSRGFHFCSLEYLKSFLGDKIMAVKVNPKDVVAIPVDYNYSKGRTWKYEVVYEVADYNTESATRHAPLMNKAVVEVAKERRVLLRTLLELPSVRRAIRKGHMSLANIKKNSYGRLAAIYKRLVPAPAPKQSAVLQNSLLSARLASGITVGQVAQVTGDTYKSVWHLERSNAPGQEAVDRYIAALACLTGKGHRDRAVVSSSSEIVLDSN